MAKKLPWHGVIGVALVSIFWALNWGLGGLRTHFLFFPLWLGYILAVDGLVYWRQGHSLLTRSRWRFAWLFILSIPVWWLFEAINLRTRNWSYLGSSAFGFWEYAFWASLNFSTVIPAVFVTTEAVAVFSRAQYPNTAEAKSLPELAHPARFILLGAIMLAALMAFPDYAYPVTWLSLFFLVDPINAAAGRRSLLRQMAAGRWRGAITLGLAALICGFFWELWNFYSYPKWVYRIPFVDFAKVFEMPLLGYGGYIPFAWELYAIYHLFGGLRSMPRLIGAGSDFRGGQGEAELL